MLAQGGALVPMAVWASLIAGSVTTLGILAVRRFSEWGRRNATYFACFAVSFLHMVPKSLGLSDNAPMFMLVGYLAMHFFNRFVTTQVCDKPTTTDYAIGLVPMLGIGFHSFVDGVIYSITFSVSLFTGVVSALGMVLHEFPEGIVTYILLLRSGFGRKWALWLAFLAAAVTTPLGTIASYSFVSSADEELLGGLLALSAGRCSMSARRIFCRWQSANRAGIRCWCLARGSSRPLGSFWAEDRSCGLLCGFGGGGSVRAQDQNGATRHRQQLA